MERLAVEVDTLVVVAAVEGEAVVLVEARTYYNTTRSSDVGDEALPLMLTVEAVVVARLDFVSV